MSRRLHPAIVGAFVIGGLSLLVGAFAIWGVRRAREHRYEYVSYFSGAASGLKVDAPVTLFGARIGSVSRIRIYSFDHPESLLIAAFISFNEEQLRGLGARRAPTAAVLRGAIRNGLRARLGRASLLTHDRGIDLDFVPESPVVYREPPDAERIPEIPTAPPASSPEWKAIEDLVTHLDEVDFKELSESITDAANGIGQASGSIGRLAGETDRRLERLEKLLLGSLGAEAPPIAELRRAMASVDKAARELASLAEYLRRNPSSLIRGKAADSK